MLTPGSLSFRRAAIVCGSIVAAVYLGIKIPEEPFFFMLMLGVAGYVFTLPLNYRWLAWLIIATAPSAIILPGLPGRPFLWEACSLAAWPSLVAYFALNRRRLTEVRLGVEARRAAVCLIIYIGVLVLVMLVRGVGFRVFGGEQMGGRFYVQQLILAILPLLLLTVDWCERTLLSAFYTGIALTVTYLVSDLVFVYGGRSTEFLLYFLELPTDAINFYIGHEFSGLRRFQSFAFVGDALFLCLLTVLPLRRIFGGKMYIGLPWLLGAVLLGLASGHRTILVQAVCTLAFLGAIQRVYTPMCLIGLSLVLAIGGWGLFNHATELPLGVQRSISFIPGLKVDPLASADAEATLNDRIEALKLGLNDVPRYLWIGRGFGLARLDKHTAGTADDSIMIAYESGYFDNGVIGLLLKTGLVGLLAALGYLWFISRAALRCVALVGARPEAERDTFDLYCQLMVAKWFALVVFFLFLRGDASTFMQVFALASAVILLCLKFQQRRAEAWSQ